MQVFKVLTIIKVKVICIQSESGLHQPMKAKVGNVCPYAGNIFTVKNNLHLYVKKGFFLHETNFFYFLGDDFFDLAFIHLKD
jgi:hypothetical protein